MRQATASEVLARTPCTLTQMGISRLDQAKQWNDYVAANPKCGLASKNLNIIVTELNTTKSNALEDGYVGAGLKYSRKLAA